ncbi:MAG: hypothetical protein HOJ95_01680 [Nitrospinaceae bacterium]|nr:hypothetical protein [Nitrospinaceae bacterium]
MTAKRISSILTALTLALMFLLSAAAPNAEAWWTKVTGGGALDIGIGGGKIWLIGSGTGDGGNRVYRWTGSGWQFMNAHGVRLDVDEKGIAWVVNNNGRILRYNGSNWYMSSLGFVKDVGIGANGVAWIIGWGDGPGGQKVYRRGAQGSWQDMNAYGVRIDVDPWGNAWLVKNDGSVWRWTGSSWVGTSAGGAKDVGIGANGSTWIIGYGAGGNQIYKWDAPKWLLWNGGGISISADSNGKPWVVQNAAKLGAILRGTGDVRGYQAPATVGMTQAEASKMFFNAGLQAGYIAKKEVYSQPDLDTKVWAQGYPTGTWLPPTTKVNLWVYKNIQLIIPPFKKAVTRRKEYKNLIESLGLRILNEPNVCGQNQATVNQLLHGVIPAPGTVVKKGACVTLQWCFY